MHNMKKYIFHENSKSNLTIYIFSILIISIVLFVSYMGYKSESTEMLSYTSLFICIIILFILFGTWMVYRIADSILIDSNSLIVSTQKLQAQIMLDDILEVKYFSMKTTGDTYVWIKKKKGIKKSKLTFFRITFVSGELEGMNNLSNLISELDEIVSVKEILTYHFKKKTIRNL